MTVPHRHTLTRERSPWISCRTGIASLFAAVALITVFAQQAHADDLFKGKIVRLVVGSAPGGSYDAYARLVARHLGQYLAGQPTVIVQNLPGASGATSASFLYSSAPRDGLTI